MTEFEASTCKKWLWLSWSCPAEDVGWISFPTAPSRVSLLLAGVSWAAGDGGRWIGRSGLVFEPPDSRLTRTALLFRQGLTKGSVRRCDSGIVCSTCRAFSSCFLDLHQQGHAFLYQHAALGRKAPSQPIFFGLIY